MDKATFMGHVRELYRAANKADTPERPDWMHPRMAGDAGCAALDQMLYGMAQYKVLSGDELQQFYDTL